MPVPQTVQPPPSLDVATLTSQLLRKESRFFGHGHKSRRVTLEGEDLPSRDESTCVKSIQPKAKRNRTSSPADKNLIVDEKETTSPCQDPIASRQPNPITYVFRDSSTIDIPSKPLLQTVRSHFEPLWK